MFLFLPFFHSSFPTLRYFTISTPGANPTLTRDAGQSPLDAVRRLYPDYLFIALLEQVENEKTSFLVKARHLAAAANSNAVAPSCLQGRMARGQPLPRVALVPLTDGQNDDEEEEGRKFRTALAFMCGLGRAAMPRDVFRVVMDLLMQPGDPLRRKGADTEPPVPEGSAKKRRRKKRKKKSGQEG